MRNVVEVLIGATAPSFTQRSHLDGREYVLAFRWSQREERWYLDLSDVNGALLVGSIKLVLFTPLLKFCRGVPGLPPGQLTLVDNRPTPAPPKIDELGTVAHLIYTEAAA